MIRDRFWIAVVVTMALTSLAGCRVALTERMPADVPLDPMWDEFESPLGPDEVFAAANVPLDVPEVDPFEAEPFEADPLGFDATEPVEDDPLEATPSSFGADPAVVDVADRRGPLTGPTTRAPRGAPAVCDVPQPPPPPTWDPSRDRKVSREVFEGSARPAAASASDPLLREEGDAATAIEADPMGVPPAGTGAESTGPSVDPLAPMGVEAPSTTPMTTPVGPTTTAPGTTPVTRTPLSVPATRRETPQRIEPTPFESGPPPLPDVEDDPWGGTSTPPATDGAAADPLVDPVPATPLEVDPLGSMEPVSAPPSAPGPDKETPPPAAIDGDLPSGIDGDLPSGIDGDPWGDDPAPAPAPPETPAGDTNTEDDPWGDSPASAGSANPTPPVAEAGTEDDPWGDIEGPSAPVERTTAGAGAERPRFVGETRVDRAMEQVTRLLDRPGDPRVEGYPREVVPTAEAWVALREGPRPLVIVFHDDAKRASDQLAAEILPVLAEFGERVDIVTVDCGPKAAPDRYGRLVLDRYLGSDDEVPVTVVARPDRTTALARFGWFPADDLSSVLDKLLEKESDPDAADETSPVPAGQDPRPAPAEPEVRDDILFSTPSVERARQHADALRARPTDAALQGYPAGLVTHADPALALEPGSKPVVIVFHDDTSRVSNLQAADLLPVLVAAGDAIDVVVIDVAAGAERNEVERRVVRPYYPGTVPATVVLSARRAPVKLWFQRTSAKALSKAIDAAKDRR